MGDAPEAPPPPDYTPLVNASREAAAESIALQREQFAWAKQAYAENKGVTDQVVDSFLDTQEVNATNAAKDRERYERIYQPLEDNLAQEAQNYATPERKELERGRAVANVSQQFENARQSATQQLESFGINPASTRFAALDIGVRTQQAAAAAGAANQADQQTDATGRALRSEAINVGRGYPGQIAGTYSTSNQAGQGAVNSGLATTASGASSMGTPTQWGALGATNLTSAGNLMAQGYKDAFAAADFNSKQSSGLGTALGLAAGIGGKFLFAAEGGAVPDGTVPPAASPTAGQAIDDVPARLTAGEYVTDKETVGWYGQKFFVNLKLKARDEKAKMEQQSGTQPDMREAVPTEPTFDSTPQALPA